MDPFGSQNYRRDPLMKEWLRDMRDTRQHLSEARREIEKLRAEVDRLRLTTAASWELVSERLDLSKDDLWARLHTIDARDGARDGSLDNPTTACPTCDRNNNAQRVTCMYCGAAMPRPPAF